MSARSLLLLAVLALGLVSPTYIQAWGLDDLGFKPIPIRSDLHVVPSQTSADLDGDGIPELLALTKGHASLQTGTQTRWQSPEAWQVRQAQIADLNHDGRPEVALLVWRPFKPWPVDAWLPHGGRINDFHNANGMSCHIILIGWKQDAFRELWAGSAMADPVKRFAAVDLMGTGLQYLVTLEGAYDDPPSVPARRLKAWEWNGFGFTAVNELEDEHAFRFMGTGQTKERQVLILSH